MVKRSGNISKYTEVGHYTVVTETLLLESAPERVSIEFKYQCREHHLHFIGLDAETSKTLTQIKAKLSSGLHEDRMRQAEKDILASCFLLSICLSKTFRFEPQCSVITAAEIRC